MAGKARRVDMRTAHVQRPVLTTTGPTVAIGARRYQVDFHAGLPGAGAALALQLPAAFDTARRLRPPRVIGKEVARTRLRQPGARRCTSCSPDPPKAHSDRSMPMPRQPNRDRVPRARAPGGGQCVVRVIAVDDLCGSQPVSQARLRGPVLSPCLGAHENRNHDGDRMAMMRTTTMSSMSVKPASDSLSRFAACVCCIRLLSYARRRNRRGPGIGISRALSDFASVL